MQDDFCLPTDVLCRVDLVADPRRASAAPLPAFDEYFTVLRRYDVLGYDGSTVVISYKVTKLQS